MNDASAGPSRTDDSPAAADDGRCRRSPVVALAVVPYLAGYTWYVAGATLSALGRWPGWPGHPLGYYPEEGLAGAAATLIVLTFWCFPVPAAAFAGAVYTCWAGSRVAPRRRAAWLWVLPTAALTLAALGVTVWSAVVTFAGD